MFRWPKGELLHGFPGDESDLGLGDHLHAVVGDAQEGILKVDHVARHMYGDYLAGSVGHDLVPDRKAGKKHARVRRYLPLTNDISLAFDFLHAVREQAEPARRPSRTRPSKRACATWVREGIEKGSWDMLLSAGREREGLTIAGGLGRGQR